MGNSDMHISKAGSAILAAMAGVTAGIVAVALTALVILATSDTRPTEVTARGALPTPDAPAPPPGIPRPSSTAVSVKAFVDIRELPVGLICQDLETRGYGYTAAVEYWRIQGQPHRMDADRNGIPCEPEYSRTEVGKYWRDREVNPLASVPDGLRCQDLAARGATYGEAVTYWWYSGKPSRLDTNHNGIPCETDYPKAKIDAFWHQ